MQKFIVQQIYKILFCQISFQKLARHQKGCGKQIRLPFGYIRSLTGYLTAQPEAKFVIDMQLFLVVKQVMAELVRNRKILTDRMMARIHPDNGLIAIEV